MKKIIWLLALLAICMCFGLASCNSSDRDAGNEDEKAEDGNTSDTEDGNTTDTEVPDNTTSDGKSDEEPTETLEYKLSDDKKYYIVVGIGSSSGSEIAIPDEYNELPVSEIADGAFKNCTAVQAITIPESVTLVGTGAFEGCTALTQIYVEADSTPEGLDTAVGSGEISVELGVEKGHRFGLWVISKEAECETEGSRWRECADCGEKTVDDIPETGHTEVTLPAVEPTATAYGLTEGKKCSVCGKVTAEQTTRQALGFDQGVWDGTVADGFLLGSGAEDDPYLISSGAQLAYLANAVNAGNIKGRNYYLLVSDIDLGGLEWTPIGCCDKINPSYAKSGVLSGNFDGNGHTVSNFKITVTDTTSSLYYGLFGCVSGTVENLRVIGFTIDVSNTSYLFAGGIAGYAYVENCYAEGSISAKTTPQNNATIYAGGIVGKGCVSSCTAAVSVKAESANGYAAAYVGGITGEGENVNNCIATGDVIAVSPCGTFAGGIIGHTAKSNLYTINARACFASGDVSAQSSWGEADVGGIVGFLEGGVMQDCCATGNVTAASSSAAARAGGVAGIVNSFGAMTNCLGAGNTSASTGSTYYSACASGVVGYVDQYDISSVYIARAVANCYYFAGQVSKKNGAVTNSYAYNTYSCSVQNLANASFYTNTLRWTEGDWDLSELDVLNGKGPEPAKKYQQSAEEHQHVEVVIEGTEPTCTEYGYTELKYCSVCGQITEYQMPIAAEGHNFIDGNCQCGATEEEE